MTRIEWDKTGEHYYETGVKNAVLYVCDTNGNYGKGVAWNGITSVSESPSGGDENAIYADDTKYLSLRSKEDFNATVEAYTYPDEFALCDGFVDLMPGLTVGQQSRRMFGLCYRTSIGNDIQGDSFAYKLHIIYGATVSPSDRSYQTINDSPEAITFSWEMSTVPVFVKEGVKNTAQLTIDSRQFSEAQMKAIEDLLYGTSTLEPSLPTPAVIESTLASAAA